MTAEDGSDDGYFDERVAARYDDDPEMFAADTVDPAVDFLAELAGDGRALEFAIGMGWIALPLAQRGVLVHGIGYVGGDGREAAREAGRR